MNGLRFEILADDLSLRIAVTLFHFLWQGAVVGLLVVASAWLLRFRSPMTGYVLHCFALLCLPLCIAITFVNLEVPSSAGTNDEDREPTAVYESDSIDAVAELPRTESPPLVADSPKFVELDSTPPPNEAGANVIARESEVEVAQQEPRNTNSPLLARTAPFVVIAYAIGACFFLLRLGVAVWGGHRLRNVSKPIVDSKLIELVAQQSRKVGLKFVPIVSYCEKVAVPTVVGVLRPAILLPASIVTGLNPEQFAAIISHELAHIRRYDLLMNLIQRLIESLLFFHPAVWYISHRMSAEREACCDDLVVSSGYDRMDYAGALLRVAELCSPANQSQVAVAATGRNASQLEIRIQRLMSATNEPRLRLTRVGVFSFFALLVLVAVTPAVFWNGAHAQPNEATENSSPPGKDPDKDEVNGRANGIETEAHLLTIVNRGDRDRSDHLLLVTIPAAGTKDQESKVRAVVSERGFTNFLRPIGVHGGHLLAMKMHQLVSIDLKTGKQRVVNRAVINAAIAGDRLFMLSAIPIEGERRTRALTCMDLKTGVVRKLYDAAVGTQKALTDDTDCSLAPTSDGSHIALTETGEINEREGTHATCRVVLIDVDRKRVMHAATELPSRVPMTGYGTKLLAPKLAWVDDEILIAAAPAATGASEFLDRSPAMQIVRFESMALQSEVVCKLPKFSVRMHQPWFSQHGSGAFINLGDLGQYRIDLAAKKLVEDSSLGRNYELRGAKKNISLWHGESQLAERTGYRLAFPSADGRRVAWLPWDIHPSNSYIFGPLELKVHDAVRGTRTVLKERFARYVQTPQDPTPYFCRWLTNQDLKRSDVFDEFPLVEDKTKAAPRVDTRPAAKDAVEVTLTTDKKEYSRHEPVQLSVTVKNISKDAIIYESKRLMHGAQPFDLSLRSATSRSSIDLFEWKLNEPKEEFIEIAPGKSRSFVRPVEIEETGEQTFRLRFEQWGKWKGYVLAEAPITVSASDDDGKHLKKKFDRFVERCLTEYPEGADTINVARFRQLGSAGAPLLVEYLRKCDDAELQGRMIKGLEGIADERTLPYLRNLLKTEMEHGADHLVAVLWAVHRRGVAYDKPVPESLGLLIAAGKHPNVSLRRKAVAQLCGVINKDVDAFMQSAAEDSDQTVAETAARFVAARQQLSLGEWLDVSSKKLTPVSLVAARSIVDELEQTRNEALGDIPSGLFKEVASDTAKLNQYKDTLKAWHAWARENPRASNTFFDDARIKAATGYRHWVYDASRQKPPAIVLRPSTSVDIPDTPKSTDKEPSKEKGAANLESDEATALARHWIVRAVKIDGKATAAQIGREVGDVITIKKQGAHLAMS